METLLGKALGDLASIFSQRWYAGMGFGGLIIVVLVLLVGTPHDDLLVGAIGVAMFGFGCAEAETRSFQKRVLPGMIGTRPVRSLNAVGIALYLLGTGGLGVALGRGWTLLV